MANTTVTTDKTAYNANETISVTVTSTGLTPAVAAVPPTVVQRHASVVRTYDTGEVDVVDEIRQVTTDPGSPAVPAQTVVSTTVKLLDDNGVEVPGATVVQVDADHFTVVAK